MVDILAEARKHQVEAHDIISRLTRHNTRNYPARRLTDIKQLVIHHTGAGWGNEHATFNQAFDRFDSHANGHVNGRDWPGIGYTFGISPAGHLFLMNPLNRITWHAGPGCNPNGIGIGVQRARAGDGVTEPIIWTLNVLVSVLKDVFPTARISAHRDCMSTECPGWRLYEEVGNLQQGSYKHLVPARESPDTNAYEDRVTGRWIINTNTDYGRVEMLKEWQRRGEIHNGDSALGRPREGMLLDYPYEGVPRFHQLFENGRLECWPLKFGDRTGPVYRLGGLGNEYLVARARITELEEKLLTGEDCGCSE